VAIDKHKIDETVLALLRLTLHDGCRAWKSFHGDRSFKLKLSRVVMALVAALFCASLTTPAAFAQTSGAVPTHPALHGTYTNWRAFRWTGSSHWASRRALARPYCSRAAFGSAML